ncbi:MAG: hypothetical protein Q7R96_03070 [Nanoarchaeota archaeon]|nr:hypothetical protein [Nanoarchaeota archaeon]
MTKDSTPRKMTFEDLARNAGRDDVLTGILRGRISPSASFAPEDVTKLESGLEALARGINPSNDLQEAGKIYVVTLRNPLNGVEYLTLMQNGKIELTLTDDQKHIDWDALQRDHLIGDHSLEHVFTDVFATAPGPFQEKRDVKPSEKKGTPKVPGDDKPKKAPPRSPHPKIQYAMDPRLYAYFKQKYEFLTYAVFAHSTEKKPVSLSSPADLASIGLPASAITAAAKFGLEVVAQETVGFVNHHKKEILRARRSHLKILEMRPDLRNMIAEYWKSLEGPNGQEDVIAYLKVASHARAAYQYFTAPEHRLADVPPAEVLDALRHASYHMVERDTKDRKDLVRSLGEWVAVAHAADFVTHDTYIAEQVIPLFAKTKDADPKHAGELVYDGMRLLLQRVTKQELHYNVDELNFIVQGLWYNGYFTKATRGSSEESLEDRDARGVRTQFILPARHLLRRYPLYSNVLREALDTALVSDAIPKDFSLASHADDSALAKILYFAVPEEVRSRTFMHLMTGQPLQTLGPGNEGQQVRWILEYYVGVNRDVFAEEIRKFHA